MRWMAGFVGVAVLVCGYVYWAMAGQPGPIETGYLAGRWPEWGRIGAVSYHPSAREMRVDFRSGRSIVHRGVAPDLFAGFMRARRKMEFYNRFIRGSGVKPTEPAPAMRQQGAVPSLG